jgi:hypothetical protein
MGLIRMREEFMHYFYRDGLCDRTYWSIWYMPSSKVSICMIDGRAFR